MFCKEKCDDRAGADPHIIINKSAYTAKKQSTGYAADKSRQHRHNYLKRLYKHKHKRRKQPKPTYVSLKCINRPEIAFKPCLLTGSVEVAPRAGLADAICDLVSTGATLEANGLKEVEVIYRSKACLIARESAMGDAKESLIKRLLVRMQGVARARECKYIMLHAPKSQLNAITKILPGAEHPTILPLEGDATKVAMHMVSKENLFWETMEQLKALGASSILVLPIEKMME